MAMFCDNRLLSKPHPKAESLTDNSVRGPRRRKCDRWGIRQRPTKQGKKYKAESLADKDFHGLMRKAFSLDFITYPIRRALPYAIIRKGFALGFGKKSTIFSSLASIPRRLRILCRYELRKADSPFWGC